MTKYETFSVEVPTDDDETKCYYEDELDNDNIRPEDWPPECCIKCGRPIEHIGDDLCQECLKKEDMATHGAFSIKI